MNTSTPAGPERSAGPPLMLFALLNAPAVVAVGVTAVVLSSGSASWRWPAAAALVAALVAAVLANARRARALRRAAARRASARRAAANARRDAADARRQLRSVFDTAADGILTFEEGGRISSVNAAACRMFGYDEARELRGQSIEVILPGLRGDGLVGTDERRALGVSSPFEARHRTGATFLVAVGISKVRIKGRATFTTIVHDLTALQQARYDAEAASRAKSSFLLHMSHELRTPLVGIMGMADVLAGSPLSPEQRRQLQMLQRSAESLLSAVARLQDYSRLEAGELALARRPFSLRQLVTEVLAPLAEQARAKGLRLVAPPARGDLPDWFVGDPERLRQVLLALVENAVKFTKRGEVALRVRAEGKAAGGAGVLFEVRDTGGGVPEGQRTRIFQPFEQGDNSSTKAHGGLGLGLSIAARLVELMGGRISVDSAAGHGSTFRLSVPLDVAEAPPAAPVLLVLGEGERRRARQEQVAAWGWPAVAVGTGKAAREELMAAVVRGAPFRLVVVDAELPDVPGRDVLRWLDGRDECRCPALLLGDGAEALLPAGATLLLPRDAGPSRLREAMQQALASAALVS